LPGGKFADGRVIGMIWNPAQVIGASSYNTKRGSQRSDHNLIKGKIRHAYFK